MSTLLKQRQNAGKALKIRMERESQEKYHVILAGMTIYNKSSCANGTCEGNFMYTENMTQSKHLHFSKRRFAGL